MNPGPVGVKVLPHCGVIPEHLSASLKETDACLLSLQTKASHQELTKVQRITRRLAHQYKPVICLKPSKELKAVLYKRIKAAWCRHGQSSCLHTYS